MLERLGVPYTLRRFKSDPRAAGSYGMSAARALGEDPSRVFKTLMVSTPGGLVCAVVPVAGSLDLKALAQAVGEKRATMADVAHAERATGYMVGGISPIGQRHRHRTVIDISAQDFPTVLVSAGARAADIELAPKDLAKLTKAVFAHIGHE
jgi:Cys-tRNA(Pro)/Cys-tRNA(Cys) deacylase